MNLHYYCRVYRRMLINAVTREIMFRANFVTGIAVSFIWMFFMILVVELLFGYTDAIAGWDKGSVYLLTFVWFLIDRISAFGWAGMNSFSGLIRYGRFDWLLTRPTDVQFAVSFYRPKITAAVELIAIGIIYAIIFSTRVPVPVQWAYLPLFAVFVLSGMIIDYSIQIILQTLNFWFINLSNVSELWDTFREIGRYPHAVFARWLKILFLTVLPISLLGNVQAQALLGENAWYLVVLAVALAVFFFLSSRMFFLFALKRYSSASS